MNSNGDGWNAPAIAPWDVDTETGVLNEEFTPIGSTVHATAIFDITVPGGEEEMAEDADAEAEEAEAAE